jgi:hypothetical protein
MNFLLFSRQWRGPSRPDSLRGALGVGASRYLSSKKSSKEGYHNDVARNAKKTNPSLSPCFALISIMIIPRSWQCDAMPLLLDLLLL